MIALEKPYRKEPIPGLRKAVDKAVQRRLWALIELHDKNPSYITPDMRQMILGVYDQWEADDIYPLCPFSSLLDTYPGPGDWTALGTFQKALEAAMTEKEQNQWATNIITAIRQQLWPRNSPVTGLLNTTT